MSLRTWLLFTLGMLFVQGVLAQEKMRTYDPQNSGRRSESVEPPLADGSSPVGETKPKLPAEPRLLPREVQEKPPENRELLPAQMIVPNPVIKSPTQPISYLATPVLTIDVVGAENAADGGEVKYTFVVRNRSEAKAHHVLVRSVVPKNATLVKASIPPKEEKVGETTELQWPLETVGPGESRTIEVLFRPNPNETELRVLARVQFDHGRWMVTKLAKPGLTLKKTAPKEGVLYEAIPCRIEVSNPTKLTITDVKIEDALDEGLEYEREANAKIDNEKNQRSWSIPSLAAGERKVFDYLVIAKKTGAKRGITRVSASGVSPQEEVTPINIVEARLQMRLTPVPQATVGQPAEVQLNIENKGTATLNNIRLYLAHPAKDVEVKRATQGSKFFDDGVQWIITQLKAGESREFKVQFTAKTPGKRKFTATAKADRGAEVQDETQIDFEGIPSLNWKTDGTPTSTEGKDVKYLVEVYNPGTANATNVTLQVKLPPEVRLETANPPYDGGASNGILTFKPIHIPPKTKATFAINCLAVKKGVATFHFDLLADHTKKSGTQHNEVSTIINARETLPAKLDRTTQTPKELPIKEKEPTKSEPIIAVKQEPKKEVEPEPNKTAAPKKEPEGIPPLDQVIPLGEKKEPEKKESPMLTPIK